MVAYEAIVASKWPQRSYDLRFEISNLDYPGIHVHIAPNNYGGLQWQPLNGLRGHMTSDLISKTLIILVSMCILPRTAMVSSEAMASPS